MTRINHHAWLQPPPWFIAILLLTLLLQAAHIQAAMRPDWQGHSQTLPLPVEMFVNYAKEAQEFRVLFRSRSDLRHDAWFFEQMLHRIPCRQGMRADIYSFQVGNYPQQQAELLSRLIQCPSRFMPNPHGLDMLAQGKGLTLILDGQGGSAVLGEKALIPALRTSNNQQLYLAVFGRR